MNKMKVGSEAIKRRMAQTSQTDKSPGLKVNPKAKLDTSQIDDRRIPNPYARKRSATDEDFLPNFVRNNPPLGINYHSVARRIERRTKGPIAQHPKDPNYGKIK